MARRPSPKARLASFVGLLSVAAFAVLLLAPIDREGLRDVLDPFGVAAPLAYVCASVLLGNVFVPGPILAGTSGLLFGTTTGFFVSLTAATLASALAVAIARAAGRPGVEELESQRVRAVERLLHKRPVLAVVVQRLMPGVPDAPCSYLYGLAGLAVWQVALGTVLGAAPRAFSYTAIGDGLGEGSSTIAVVGAVALVVTGIAGAIVAAVAVRRGREER